MGNHKGEGCRYRIRTVDNYTGPIKETGLLSTILCRLGGGWRRFFLKKELIDQTTHDRSEYRCSPEEPKLC